MASKKFSMRCGKLARKTLNAEYRLVKVAKNKLKRIIFFTDNLIAANV